MITLACLWQVGFNRGDDVLYYEHPFSVTSSVLHINSHTNVGVTGRWLYRVDGNADVPDSSENSTCARPSATGKLMQIHRLRWHFFCFLSSDVSGIRAQGGSLKCSWWQCPLSLIEIYLFTYLSRGSKHTIYFHHDSCSKPTQSEEVHTMLEVFFQWICANFKGYFGSSTFSR